MEGEMYGPKMLPGTAWSVRKNDVNVGHTGFSYSNIFFHVCIVSIKPNFGRISLVFKNMESRRFMSLWGAWANFPPQPGQADSATKPLLRVVLPGVFHGSQTDPKR